MSFPITNIPRREQYNSAYTQTVFTVPFFFYQNTDLKVYRRAIDADADDADDLLTYAVDYTVTGANTAAGGGTVTTITSPGFTVNQILTIVSDMPEERLNSYINGGLTPEALNFDASQEVIMNQQNQMNIRQLTPRYQQNDIITAKDLTLPRLSAGTFWIMNSDNTGIRVGTLPEAGGDVELPVESGHIARFLGTTGTIENSPVRINDDGDIFDVESISIGEDGAYFSNPIDDFTTSFKRQRDEQFRDLVIYSPEFLTLDSSDSLILSGFQQPFGSAQMRYAKIPGRNRIINGNFQVWQRGVLFVTLGIADNGTYGPDCWQLAVTGAVTGDMQQFDGVTSGQYRAAVARTNGNAAIGQVQFLTTLTRSRSIGMAGKKLSLRFKALKGADYSSAGDLLNYSIYYGTGNTDKSFLSGFTGSTLLATGTVTLTTTEAGFIIPPITAAPTNATQFALMFWYTTTGTAGVHDEFRLTDVQLEPSDFPTPYEFVDFAETWFECCYFYQKSFLYDTQPAENAGANTGEQIFIATRAGAATNRSPTIQYSRPMRLSDVANLTLYNPSAANDQIRDATIDADTADATITGYNERGFSVTCTGNASTAVGDILSFHYTKDDALY